jgi:pimeloyl-ACP methyl ester carboxylesterase
VEAKFATINGVRLSYAEGEPNGPELVFLAGFPESWEDCQAFLEDLERDFHVFSPSMRGMGRSAHAPRYRISDWVSDAAAFVRKVVGPPVLGVGHSAGAWFGLSAAGRDPGLFRAFVGLDQPLNPEVHIEFHETTRPTYAGFAAAMQSASATDDLARRLASVPSSRGGVLEDRVTEAELLELAAWLATADPHIFDAWVNDDLRGLLSVPELTDWPGRFSGSVLFVYGDPEAGSLVDRDARGYNLERYPWAEVAEISGADHQLGINGSPSRVADEIRGYLRQFT